LCVCALQAELEEVKKACAEEVATAQAQLDVALGNLRSTSDKLKEHEGVEASLQQALTMLQV
jgi:hypothetical protein